MNLIQIEKVLSNLITNSFVNPNVKIGCIYDNLNTDEIKYPVVDIDCESATKSENEDIYNFIVYYVDRLTESEDNLNNIQNDGITAIKLLVRKLSNNEDFEVELPVSINPFHQTFNHTTFADNCAGAWARIVIHTEDSINYCSEETVTSTINITKNGEYDVLGYDKANVNVLPDIETKTVEYTSNGEYTILPSDENTYLDKVNVKVNVQDTNVTKFPIDSRWNVERKDDYCLNANYQLVPNSNYISFICTNTSNETIQVLATLGLDCYPQMAIWNMNDEFIDYWGVTNFRLLNINANTKMVVSINKNYKENAFIVAYHNNRTLYSVLPNIQISSTKNLMKANLLMNSTNKTYSSNDKPYMIGWTEEEKEQFEKSLNEK